MGKLDFSGINKIAYKHFEDKPEERDALLKAGFIIVDNIELPFPKEEEAPAPPPPPPPVFTDHTGSQDYKKMYRAAYEFHKRNSPPMVDRDYWKDKTPGEDETPEAEVAYWDRVNQEMSEAATAYHNAPLMWAFLSAVSEELEREYKAIRDGLRRR